MDFAYDHERAETDLSNGQVLMNEDTNIYEIDPEPYLDRLYNEILGNIRTGAGTWVRDPKKTRIMNEHGASTFRHEISCRFSTHTNFSELTIEEIKNLAGLACKAWADNAEDNFITWDLNSSIGNLNALGERLYSILIINLKIAQNAGMRVHRERSRNPYLRQTPPAQIQTEEII
tara:strand:+ start:129 stop:653 length:525 start_codon:yes stop_codon:yes gene_type:complete